MAGKKDKPTGLAGARIRKKVGCAGIGTNCGVHFVFTYNEYAKTDVEYYGRCKRCPATIKLKERSLTTFIKVMGQPEFVAVKNTFEDLFDVEDDKKKPC